MITNTISCIIIIVLLIVLFGLFLFIATRSWGVNWWTWVLAWPGSMKKGFLVIISLFAAFLLAGYLLGLLN